MNIQAVNLDRFYPTLRKSAAVRQAETQTIIDRFTQDLAQANDALWKQVLIRCRAATPVASLAGIAGLAALAAMPAVKPRSEPALGISAEGFEFCDKLR